ncbi:Palmitoyltransferase ZDHHC17 [Lasiodiplodia hormozganensis]|uniref:Palmitoyltransferase ZDHHC17 n=1 Tax=Lasiodiplodia hormozganensis TaxID=869390 RepID=A0AA39X1K0_9PEZI|nr:Palmitoyltransferase ZDHHC17 [Lasiodiplodia hormozganensis]
MLVFAGVDPNARDNNGEYTLQKIFKGPDTTGLANHRLEALALLLQSDSNGGTKVNIRVSGTLDTPLHLAVYRRSAMAVAMLLIRGADVNVANSYGSTPLLSTALMWRAELQDSEQQILELLSEREEIDLDVVSGVKRRTALHYAVLAGAATAVDILLEKKANFRVKDADGHEPIDLLEGPRRRASPADGDIRAMLLEAAGEPPPETENSEGV